MQSTLRSVAKYYLWQTASVVRESQWRVRQYVRARQGVPVAHFLHINKAAGSALKETLFEHRITPAYVLRLHNHRTTLMDVPAGDKFFFFLRHPVSRFVSGFNHRLHKGRPKYFTEWTDAEASAFAMFGSAEELAVSLTSEDGARRASAESAMRSIFHVQTSFWDWFQSKDYFDSRLEDLLFIGFQETLPQDFQRLARILVLPTEIALVKDDRVANRGASGRSDERLGATALSKRAEENVSRWFASDIEFYNHCCSYARDRWGTPNSP